MSITSKRNHIKQGRLVIVADLYKRGWTIRKITQEVRARMNSTVSERTIWNDVQYLLKEWRSVRISDIDSVLQLELERIDDCVCELWQQWEKSKEDWVKENNKRIGVPVASQGADKDQTEIQTIKRENQTENIVGLGNPAYIAEIRQQLIERRKLLGLYVDRKEITGKNGKPLTFEPIQIEIIDSTNQII